MNRTDIGKGKAVIEQPFIVPASALRHPGGSELFPSQTTGGGVDLNTSNAAIIIEARISYEHSTDSAKSGAM